MQPAGVTMKLITVGITAIDGDIECIMSDKTDAGKQAAKLLSSFVRSILFEMNSNQPLLYKIRRDGIISYSFIHDGRIYTICTDTEIYPYTPSNLNYLHNMLRHIIAAHRNQQSDLISKMITEGESHQPDFDMSSPHLQSAVRLHQLSSDHLNKLEADIEHLKEKASELTTSFAFFAPKREPVKKSSSFMSRIRWFFSFFSVCGSCMRDDHENRPQQRHRW